MTNVKLANELQAISRELDEILANERAAAIELDRRFAEEHGAIEELLQSVQEAKLGGRWRNTRFNVFDVLGRPRLEEAHSSFLAWVLDPAEHPFQLFGLGARSGRGPWIRGCLSAQVYAEGHRQGAALHVRRGGVERKAMWRQPVRHPREGATLVSGGGKQSRRFALGCPVRQVSRILRETEGEGRGSVVSLRDTTRAPATQQNDSLGFVS